MEEKNAEPITITLIIQVNQHILKKAAEWKKAKIREHENDEIIFMAVF